MNDCPYSVVYTEVYSVGKPHIWCEVRSLVSQELSALAYTWQHTRGALESKRRQQLDRCLAATVWAAWHHSLSPLTAWKLHQCIHTRAWRRTPTVTETREHVYQKSARDVDELKQHLIEHVVSSEQNFIDQATDQWQDCFIASVEPKSKHFEHLLWCVSP